MQESLRGKVAVVTGASRLVTEEAGWITGQNICVKGGFAA